MQPTYWDSFSTVSLFSLGNILMEPSAIFFGDSCYVFREKLHMGMQKMKFQ
jgi:hypothetical protein